MLDSFKRNVFFSILITASFILSYILWSKSGSLTDNIYGLYSSKQNNFQQEYTVNFMDRLSTEFPRTERVASNLSVPSPTTLEQNALNTSKVQEIPRVNSDYVDKVFQELQGKSHLWFEENSQEIQDDKIKTLGMLHNSSEVNVKYAVFSSTTSNREALGFAFYLPLTVLSWHRIGFRSIIILVGNKEKWYADEVLHYILECILDLNSYVIFLEPREERSVMISQVSRIFTANILQTLHPSLTDYYLVTSDSDLWPIMHGIYDLPANKSILSLNSECCGYFTHRGANYKMLPMSNIGMRGSTWREVTSRFSFSPTNVEEIITFLLREFGSVAIQAVEKGENLGWYQDQRSLSILVAEWVKVHPSSVKYVPRNVGDDRIDRSSWNPRTLERIIDAHLLEKAFIPGTDTPAGILSIIGI